MDGTFTKKKAGFVSQSPHTVTVKHSGQKLPTTYSMRDVAETPLNRFLNDGEERAEANQVTVDCNSAEMEGTKKKSHKMAFSVTSTMKRLRSGVQDRHLRKSKHARGPKER